jgi:MOSC domain-containing protein YiiM
MPDPHRVLGLWLRPTPGAPVVPAQTIEAVSGSGLTGDHTFGRMRHVTIVFEDDWRAAAATLGREVDPAGRRANVLVSGGGGARFVGTTIRIGDVAIEVKGVTEPCPVMDEAAPGMQAALKPGGLAGVWGRVVRGGAIGPGDELVEARGRT